jgi:beta-lysine 5,6-aminomutase alpha subunit
VRVSPNAAQQVQTLRRQAADLARRLSVEARGSATIAQERAVLRMIGVDGLDRAGRPLAAATVERFCGATPDRLAAGILLPFALAAGRHDLAPRELALDVAAGVIDLAAEAESADAESKAAAEVRVAALLNAALARFDANRTAARVQREVLGAPHEPWFGLALEARDAHGASGEVRRLVARGVDVVQVAVPASWEYAEAQRAAGSTPEKAGAPARGRGRRQLRGRLPQLPPLPRPDRESIPAGSQRGLAELRRTTDQAAAERGSYASLMTVASAFAAPEQAVVAAFERIDLVEADPIREIVEHNVDPARALADHDLAHRLQARAGCSVVMGAGPLTLGAEVASGMPSDAATRAGRSLALQALGAELALAGGLPPERLLLGAVPDWVAGRGPLSYLVQAWLRRAVFPGHPLVVEMPPGESAPGRTRAGWTAPLVAALAGAPAALVIVEPGARAAESGAADLAAAASSAAALRATLGDGELHGDAQKMAAETLRAAGRALRRLSGEGWESVLGPGGAEIAGARFGRSAVVARSDGPASEGRLLESLL